MKLPKNTLKYKFIKIILPAFLILTCILNIILSDFTAKMYERMINKNIEQLTINYSNLLDYYFRNLNEIYYQLHLDYNIENFLEEEKNVTDQLDYIYSLSSVKSFLSNITLIKPYILDAFITNSNNQVVAQRGTLFIFENNLSHDENWNNTLKSSDAISTYLITDSINKDFTQPGRPILLLTRKIISFKNRELLGLLTICIDFQELEKVFHANKLYDGQIFCIFDRKNNLLYPKELDVGIKNIILYGRNNSIIKYYTKELSDLVFVSYIPDEYINKELNYFNSIILIFTIVFSISLLFIIYYISGRITKPLMLLAHKMSTFRNDNSIPSINSGKIYEIEKINTSFIAMVNQINNLIYDINKKNTEIMNSEIVALQAQINPHFVYHALNTVLWISKINKIDNISKIITSLINLLQTSIYNVNRFITIEEEIDYVKDYLEIENYRFNIPITLKVIMEHELKACKTVKLILQPIVENSITHGLEDVTDNREITIRVYVQNVMLIIEVTDNGKGISQKQIDEIMEGRVSTHRLSGIGIKNVIDKIRLHFGKDYGLTIESEPGKGTTVIIKQPLSKQEDTQNAEIDDSR